MSFRYDTLGRCPIICVSLDSRADHLTYPRCPVCLVVSAIFIQSMLVVVRGKKENIYFVIIVDWARYPSS